MNKRTISILICLVLMSLACLQTAMVAQEATASPMETLESTQVSITLTPALSLQGEGEGTRICAVVIAAEAVNLRNAANEHGEWVMWLLRGDKVVVIDQSNADWWLVEIGDVSGYVRSAYVGERECEE